MNNEYTLSRFDAEGLDDAQLELVTGGYHYRHGRRFDIDVEIEINVFNVSGNGNVVAGRDANVRRRR